VQRFANDVGATLGYVVLCAMALNCLRRARNVGSRLVARTGAHDRRDRAAAAAQGAAAAGAAGPGRLNLKEE
jgi:hypothetical protein